MEEEIKKWILVWIIVWASLCYCHTAAKLIPVGGGRAAAFLPVVFLFLCLPLNLTTIHLGSTTAFFISWLANFKLLLFAFGRGPLFSNPPLPLPRFILFSCLPIKIQPPPNPKFPKSTKNGDRSPLNYLTKIILITILTQIYNYKDYLHPKLILVLYCAHLYLALELLLALVAALVRAAAQFELEPQFDEPYLATSLQDFWGRRWNLTVTGILRPTVYNPVRAISSRLVGRRWATLPAVISTFLVSGVMHELIFFYPGRTAPTGEVTGFFLLNGLCVVVEIGIKRALNGKFRPPDAVSRCLVLSFVVATALWLFLPPAMRFHVDVMLKRETAAIVGFVKRTAEVVKFRSFTETM